MAFDKDKITNDDITSRDGKILFNEKEHVYYYESKPLISVTQFIKLYTKPFEPLFPSIRKSQKNIKDKSGITDPKLLRKTWRLQSERKSHLGTSTHAFAEYYNIDRSIKPITGFEKAVINAIKELEKREWEIISQEEIVYNLNWMIAGSIDLILRNKKTKQYAIGDWKVTDDLFKSYNKMLGPFAGLDDSAIIKYSIQTDIYSLLAPYSIQEKNRIIIKLNSNGTFELYSPLSRSKDKKLPFTLDKTKKALNLYKKQNGF